MEGVDAREEVIAYEEAEEDEVVDDSVYIVVEIGVHLGLELAVLCVEILEEDVEVEQLPVGVERGPLGGSVEFGLEDVLLPEDHDVAQMGEQAQHDQVRVRPVDHVSTLRERSQVTLLQLFHELQDFVVPLSRNVRPRNHKLHLLKLLVLFYLLKHEKLQALIQLTHKLSARRDAVVLEVLRRCAMSPLTKNAVQLNVAFYIYYLYIDITF